MIKKWSIDLLSKQSIEILIDLVEIKLGSLLVQDREDAKELKKIEGCRQELLSGLSKKMLSKAERACA